MTMADKLYNIPRRKSRNRTMIFVYSVILVSFVIFAIVAVPLITEMVQPFGADSGVTACQQMAENAKQPSSGSNTPMTEELYRQKRKPFEDSQYADISVAGTNLVDTVYQAQKTSADDTNLGDAFALLSTIQTNWAALQVACKNHGVELPALTGR